VVATLQEELTKGSHCCSTPVNELTAWFCMNIETTKDKSRGAARKYFCNPSIGSVHNFVAVNTHWCY